jgi:hypothetical protein
MAIGYGKTEGFLGGVAQLGEHQLCTLGVIGSSPFTSTSLLDTRSVGEGRAKAARDHPAPEVFLSV